MSPFNEEHRNMSSGVRKKRVKWNGDTNGQTIVKISSAIGQNCQKARDKKPRF